MSGKIFAGIIFMLALCGISQADIVYTTSTGNLGLIAIDGTSIDLPEVKYSGLNGNAFAAPFWNGEESRIIAVNRALDGTESWDSALVFRSSELDSPIDEQEKVLTGIRGTRSIANSQNGRGLFFASSENASIVELDTEKLNAVRSYRYYSGSDDIIPHMQNLLVTASNIYGLVEAGEEGSYFMEFDGQLKDNVEGFSRIGINSEAATMTWLSNSRIAVGVSSGIIIVRNEGNYFAVRTDTPVKAVCSDNEDGIYFITQRYSDGEYINALHHEPAFASDKEPLRDREYGENCQLLGHGNIFAAIMGEKIIIYNASSGELIEEYDSEDLEGVPVSMSARYADGQREETSSSNCNTYGFGIVLLMCAGIMALWKK